MSCASIVLSGVRLCSKLPSSRVVGTYRRPASEVATALLSRRSRRRRASGHSCRRDVGTLCQRQRGPILQIPPILSYRVVGTYRKRESEVCCCRSRSLEEKGGRGNRRRCFDVVGELGPRTSTVRAGDVQCTRRRYISKAGERGKHLPLCEGEKSSPMMQHLPMVSVHVQRGRVFRRRDVLLWGEECEQLMAAVSGGGKNPGTDGRSESQRTPLWRAEAKVRVLCFKRACRGGTSARPRHRRREERFRVVNFL